MSGVLSVVDLALVLAVLLMVAWFVAWPPMGGGVAFAGVVAGVAARVRGAGRLLVQIFGVRCVVLGMLSFVLAAESHAGSLLSYSIGTVAEFREVLKSIFSAVSLSGVADMLFKIISLFEYSLPIFTISLTLYIVYVFSYGITFWHIILSDYSPIGIKTRKDVIWYRFFFGLL